MIGIDPVDPGKSAMITGNFSKGEARKIARSLNPR